MNPKTNKKRKKKDEFASKAGLRARGWTEKLIREFLGKPDKLAPNPHYRNAAPCQLYLLKRVKRTEKTKRFLSAKEEVSKRQKSAEAANETKRAALEKYIDGIVIKVTKGTYDEVVKAAIDHYNYRLEMFGKYEEGYASENSERSFLNRIAVNYLRHCETQYEDELDAIYGKVGVGNAYCELKKKVLDVIAVAYPDLRHECEKQKEPYINQSTNT